MAIKQRSVEDRVRQTISEMLQVREADVTLRSNLQEDLGADSLDLIELVMQLEEEFGIDINDAAGEKLRTVEDVIECVEKMAP